MKYPEHISEFWRVRSLDSSLSNTDFALYSYLCNCLNSDYWRTDTITQRRELICGLLGINGKTLEESRNRLKQKGFIDFTTVTSVNKNGKKQGVKGSATTYKILNSLFNSVPNSVLNGTPNEHEMNTKETRNGTAFKKKEEKEKEIIKMPFDSLIFIDAWQKWKTYKKEQFGFTYKSTTSENQALVQLAKMANNNESFAVEIINYSIGQAYQGLFAPKQSKPATTYNKQVPYV